MAAQSSEKLNLQYFQPHRLTSMLGTGCGEGKVLIDILLQKLSTKDQNSSVEFYTGDFSF